jgi:hypothetical protein
MRIEAIAKTSTVTMVFIFSVECFGRNGPVSHVPSRDRDLPVRSGSKEPAPLSL